MATLLLSIYTNRLASVAHGTGFADYRNLYLTGIGHLVLNLLGDIGRECLGGLIIDLVGTHNDAELTTSLDSIGLHPQPGQLSPWSLV